MVESNDACYSPDCVSVDVGVELHEKSTTERIVPNNKLQTFFILGVGLVIYCGCKNTTIIWKLYR